LFFEGVNHLERLFIIEKMHVNMHLKNMETIEDKQYHEEDDLPEIGSGVSTLTLK